MSGLDFFMAALFPWAILAAMIAYVSVGVGRRRCVEWIENI